MKLMFNDTDTHDYPEFLEHLLTSGYDLTSFAAARECKNNPYAVIRHDVDFDCEMALELARMESRLSVRSTYFFLISSESYNVTSVRNRSCIEEIRSLGHEISIHFDPVVYDDFHAGFNCEKAFFEQLFGVEVSIISLHRPTPFFLEFDQPISGVEHTYQSKFVEKLKYFADSTGVWRYGHPANSDEFSNRMNLHILVHPIWWTIDGTDGSNSEKIKTHYLHRVEQIKKHYAENCKPFSEVYDAV